jgi:hypothetical protein
MTDSLVISSRFCGPPGSGNGGYVCGRVAAYLDGPVTVTLRRPPPLDTFMAVERDGESSVRIHHGRTLIAEATSSPGSPALEIPGPVSVAEAHAVAGCARYYTDPVFPGCFVCGMGRAPGDGLRVFPGPLAGRPLWAAPWTPDPSVTGAGGKVRPEVVWAALDCPSGIAAAEAAGLARDTAVLLGRMTASLTVPPRSGDQCLVIAWPGGRDGRKLLAGSALLGPGGKVLAAARAVWLTVPRPVPALAAEGAS